MIFQEARKLGFLFFAILVIIFSIAGCGMRDNHSTDIDELRKYLILPDGVSSVSFEPVTLPESNSDGVPGPTDYSALVAVLHFQDKRSLDVAADKLTAIIPIGYPSNFVREWMSKPEQKGFHEMLSGSSQPGLLSVASWSRQKPIYAAMKRFGDESALVYICYIGP